MFDPALVPRLTWIARALLAVHYATIGGLAAAVAAAIAGAPPAHGAWLALAVCVVWRLTALAASIAAWVGARLAVSRGASARRAARFSVASRPPAARSTGRG